MNNRSNQILAGVLLACLALLCPCSCTMIEDDLSDCPTGLFVRFVYDYNTRRADMFKDHVGYVTLYVYDENGNKMAERSVTEQTPGQPLRKYGYSIHFTPDELPAGRYRLLAVAMQKDWDKAQSVAGARYSRSEARDASSFTVTLGHQEDADSETGFHAVSSEAPLDTLWHTLKVMSHAPQDGIAVPDIDRTHAPYSVYPLEEQFVSIQSNRATYATVSLIRDTKHLNITLRQIDLPDAVSHKDYEISISADNAVVAHDNSVITGTPLLYTPYAAWTTYVDDSGLHTGFAAASRTDDIRHTAHYNIMFNRLMMPASPLAPDGARLTIRNRNNGKIVADINLPYVLAEGRTAYEYGYQPQEYLDREYDYNLDFILKGDTWLYCDIRIDVLSWTRRVQNHEF